MPGQKCPKCGAETEMGYGLAGGGIGVYEYCTNSKCDHFDKWPDPELSTPEEMEVDRKRREKQP